MTWFNQAVKLWIDVKVAGKTPIIYRGGAINDTDKDDFRMSVYLSEENSEDLTQGKFYLGTSRTNLIQSIDARLIAGVLMDVVDTHGFSGLTAGKKYYWQFRPTGDPLCEGADSGIYYGYPT
jgi:hypothetical protein